MTCPLQSGLACCGNVIGEFLDDWVRKKADLWCEVLEWNRTIMFLMIFLHDGVNSKSKEEGEWVNRVEPARTIAVCCKPRSKTRMQHQGYDGIHDGGRCLEHTGVEREIDLGREIQTQPRDLANTPSRARNYCSHAL